MRRSIVLVVVTAVALIFILTFRAHLITAQDDTTPPAVSRPSGPGPITPSAPPSPSAPALPPGRHVVNGEPITTQWGVVQVRLTVERQRITDVKPMQLPHGNPTDVELSAMAVRQLLPAVLAAQSADVDMVSQATVTSSGYLRSLQSALDALHR
jgi:hypothetical protein